jgi:hypothetical protein
LREEIRRKVTRIEVHFHEGTDGGYGAMIHFANGAQKAIVLDDRRFILIDFDSERMTFAHDWFKS